MLTRNQLCQLHYAITETNDELKTQLIHNYNSQLINRLELLIIYSTISKEQFVDIDSIDKLDNYYNMPIFQFGVFYKNSINNKQIKHKNLNRFFKKFLYFVLPFMY